MVDLVYVMMIEKTKNYNRLTKAIIEEHVENIKKLEQDGKLELCGSFKGYPGMAGMFIIKAASYEEAEALCKLEPLIAGGFATYKLHRLQLANQENNYLL